MATSEKQREAAREAAEEKVAAEVVEQAAQEAAAAGQGLQLRPIDQVRKAYRQRLRPVEVPEWDMTLYFGPLTTADSIAVAEREPRNEYEKRILLLIQKARLEDGSPAFTWGDKMVLIQEAENKVLNRLLAALYGVALGDSDVEAEEVAKGQALREGKDE